MEKKKLFAYYRLSKTDRKKDVIENQKNAVNEFLKQLPDHKIIDEYQDIFVSGYDMKRPSFRKMVAEIDKADGIIMYDISRFGRNAMDSIPIFMNLLSSEKRIILVKNRKILDYSKDSGLSIWEMLVPLIELFQAQEYLTNLKKRQKIGIERYREKHKWGRPKKWGENMNKSDFIKAYTKYAEMGIAKTSIAKLLEININTLYRRLRELKREKIKSC